MIHDWEIKLGLSKISSFGVLDFINLFCMINNNVKNN